MRSFTITTAALSVGLAVAAPVPIDPNQDVSASLQNILANTHNSDAYTYPTDITRNIAPKAIHSHNDEWRDIPFYTALAAGVISVEADTYVINGSLYSGHEEQALTPARTLESLYINPILNVLSRTNPKTAFTTDATKKNGVFDTNSGQTLYLFIDLKTDGESTFPTVVSALEPLRSAGYLTTYNGTGITMGAVTVIGTGNTPLSQIKGVSPRDYFYDAPLALLPEYTNVTGMESLTASVDFGAAIGSPANGSNGFNSSQIDLMKSQIAFAKARGIGARYWDTPAWPVATRNLIWKTLVDLGVQFLNADSVGEAAGFTGEGGYW